MAVENVGIYQMSEAGRTRYLGDKNFDVAPRNGDVIAFSERDNYLVVGVRHNANGALSKLRYEILIRVEARGVTLELDAAQHPFERGEGNGWVSSG